MNSWAQPERINIVIKADDVSVNLQLAAPNETLDDLQRVLAALDNLHAGSLLAVAASSEIQDPAVIRLRESLEASLASRMAAGRFFPGLGSRSSLSRVMEFFDLMDPNDPLDVGVGYGVKRWAADIARVIDRDLASSQFPVQRIEHRSPLLISVSIGLTIPMVLTFGLLYALGRFRRYTTETEIREHQARALASVARQQEQRERFQADLYDAVRMRIVSHETTIPEGVLNNASQIASIEIGELSDKSLIGTMNLGLNLKS